MANYWLLNSIPWVAGVRLVASKSIDSAVFDIDAVKRAGGVLWPVGDPYVDAAAALAANLIATGQGNPDSTMQSAALASLKATPSGGGSAFFIWRPGVTSSGNVVATALEVSLALNANPGSLVYLDPSQNGNVLLWDQVGFDAQGAQFVGFPSLSSTSPNPQLTFANAGNCQIKNASLFKDVDIIQTLGIDSVIQFDSPEGNRCVFDNAPVKNVAGTFGVIAVTSEIAPTRTTVDLTFTNCAVPLDTTAQPNAQLINVFSSNPGFIDLVVKLVGILPAQAWSSFVNNPGSETADTLTLYYDSSVNRALLPTNFAFAGTQSQQLLGQPPQVPTSPAAFWCLATAASGGTGTRSAPFNSLQDAFDAAWLYTVVEQQQVTIFVDVSNIESYGPLDASKAWVRAINVVAVDPTNQNANIGTFIDNATGVPAFKSTPTISQGVGDPNGLVIGNVGDGYYDTSNSFEAWVKTSGTGTNTGWVDTNARGQGALANQISFYGIIFANFGDNTQTPVVFDATNDATLSSFGNVLFDRCSVSMGGGGSQDAMTLKWCNGVDIRDSRVQSGGGTSALNAILSTVTFEGACQIGVFIQNNVLGMAGPQEPAAAQISAGVNIQQLTLEGLAIIQQDPGSTIGSVTATALNSYLIAQFGNAVASPQIVFDGNIGNYIQAFQGGSSSVSIAMPAPAVGPLLLVPYCRISGNVYAVPLNLTSMSSFTYDLRGARFVATANPGGPPDYSVVTVGPGTIVDLRGAIFDVSQLVSLGSGAFIFDFGVWRVVTPTDGTTYTARPGDWIKFTANVLIGVVIDLPDATVGKPAVRVTKGGTGSVQLFTQGGQLVYNAVNGGTTNFFMGDYQSVTLESTGTEYWRTA